MGFKGGVSHRGRLETMFWQRDTPPEHAEQPHRRNSVSFTRPSSFALVPRPISEVMGASKKKTSCVGIRNGVVIQGNLSPPCILCNRIKHHTVTLSLLSLSLSIPPSLPHALPSFPLPSPPPFSHINTLKYIGSKKTLWSHFAVKLTQLGTFISSVYYSIKRNQIATPQYGIGYS